MKASRLTSEGWKGHDLTKSPRGRDSLASCFWWLLVIYGIPYPLDKSLESLPLCSHGCLPFVSQCLPSMHVSMSKVPSYKDTSHQIRAHHNPVWLPLNLVTSVETISSLDYIHRSWGNTNFRGTLFHSVQVCTHFFCFIDTSHIVHFAAH